MSRLERVEQSFIGKRIVAHIVRSFLRAKSFTVFL